MNKIQWIDSLTKWLVKRQDRYIWIDGELDEDSLKFEILEWIKSRQVYGEVTVEGFGLGHRE